MTTAEQFRDAIAHPTSGELLIGGVPWPVYKVVALLVGVVIFGLAAVITSTGTAVLTAAGAATLIWIAGGLRRDGR